MVLSSCCTYLYILTIPFSLFLWYHQMERVAKEASGARTGLSSLTNLFLCNIPDVLFTRVFIFVSIEHMDTVAFPFYWFRQSICFSTALLCSFVVYWFLIFFKWKQGRPFLFSLFTSKEHTWTRVCLLPPVADWKGSWHGARCHDGCSCWSMGQSNVGPACIVQEEEEDECQGAAAGTPVLIVMAVNDGACCFVAGSWVLLSGDWGVGQHRQKPRLNCSSALALLGGFVVVGCTNAFTNHWGWLRMHE